MRTLLIYILIIFTTSVCYSQKGNISDSIHIVKRRVINGDTAFVSEIPEVHIFPEYMLRNRSWWDVRKYQRLVRNVKAAYPYAKVAGRVLKDIDLKLSTIHNERQRKAFIEYTEKQLRGEFEGAIRNLTLSQGKILVKLIHRETGNTTYMILKNLKGNFSAGFWQTIARIFGNNLKSEYNPYGEDAMIEIIIIMIESGQL